MTEATKTTPAAAPGRQHGTRPRYMLGESGQDPARGCRCAPCSQANRDFKNNRKRMIAYGRWQPLTDAEPVRRHLRALAAAGIGWPRAAELSGVANGTVTRILYGGGSRPAPNRVRPETAAAILAVPVSPASLSDGARVDSTGTRRRLTALAAAGWSSSRLAARLGMHQQAVSRILHQREHVSAVTARAVTALYDEVWDQAPPGGTRREDSIAEATRRRAAERGWVPPAAWDDDSIDDPAAKPAQGWRRSSRRGAADLAAEARDLAAMGVPLRHAAGRLGVTHSAVVKAMARYPEAGEAA